MASCLDVFRNGLCEFCGFHDVYGIQDKYVSGVNKEDADVINHNEALRGQSQ